MRLQLERQVADLVEQDGAARRGLDPPDVPLVGAGEGALLVPEQLGRDQLRRQGATVDRDKRTRGIGRTLVDRKRRELLARAAFPAQQDRRRGYGDLPDGVVDMLHRRVGANHVRLIWIAARRGPRCGFGAAFIRRLRHLAPHVLQKLGIACGSVQNELRKLRSAEPDQGLLGDDPRLRTGGFHGQLRRDITHAAPSML